MLYAGFDALGAAKNGVAADIARGRAYENRLGLWQYLGDVSLRSEDPSNLAFAGAQRNLTAELAKGNWSAKPSKWSELVIGTHRYRLNAPE